MKVKKTSVSSKNLVVSGGKKVKVEKLKSVSFAKALEIEQESKWRQQLDKLIEEIDNQGEILREKLTFEELKKYKDLVQKFLEGVINKSYQILEERSIDRKGQKIFNIVRKIDESLEELTKMFLNKEENQLNILAKLNEIKGLLIDLYG